MKKPFASFGGALFVLMVLVSMSLTARADENVGLQVTVSPPVLNLRLEDGAPIVSKVKIHNDADVEQRLNFTVKKFKPAGQRGEPLIMDPEPEDDFISWMKIEPQAFVIAPQEWRSVDIRIEIPKEAAFSYYYALYLSSDRGSDADSVQSGVEGGAAILVLVDTQNAQAKRILELREFTAERSFYEYLPVSFDVRVENTGNVHANPSGNIFIKRSGETVDTIDINPGRGNVLPSSERIYDVEWENGFPRYVRKASETGGQGTETRTLEWDWSKADYFRWGPYTADMVLVYNDGTRDVPLEASTSFWIIPWKLLLLAIAVSLLALFGGYKFIVFIWRMISGRKKEDEG